MSLLDLTIIYLTCGAPFGVYYYLANRFTKHIWIKSIFVLFLWFPFAIRLLISHITKELREREYSVKFHEQQEAKELEKAKKDFETFLPQNDHLVSLFEFREIIERYAGLTLAKNLDAAVPAKNDKELFKINGRKNIEISSVCLNRRNRATLLSHQRDARTDFLRILDELFEIGGDKKLGKHSFEFVKLLKDDEALASINSLLKNTLQIAHDKPVKELEKDLWKQDIPTQLNDKTIPLHLKAMTATVNAPTKD